MKTLLPKLLFSTMILFLSAFIVQGACSASFTKSISGLTVSFTNASTTTSGWPNMMMYSWDFGDGTFSNAKNPVKTYSSAGTKIVQLTINDSFGCIKTMVDTFLLVAPGPTCNASFTWTNSGQTVTFTNTSTSSAGTPNIYYSWYFSDGLYSTLANPVITFPSAGYKVVQLTMYDSATHCYASYVDTIPVTSNTNSCTANFLKSVSGSTVYLANASTNTNGLPDGLSYYWYFSDGTSSTLKNPVKIFGSSGYKTINLTITDSTLGCFSSKVDSVYINSALSCAANFTAIVSGMTVNLTNTSVNVNGTSAGLSYLWYFSDGTSSTLKNPSKTFSFPGNQAVRLEISDSLTGCFASRTDTVALNVAAVCWASFTLSQTVSLTVQFTNTSVNVNGTSAGLSHLWTFFDGPTLTSSTLPSPTKVFASGGMKYAILSISDSLTGCFAQMADSFMVTTNNCTANFTKAVSGLTVNLTNTSLNTNGSGAGLSYYWYFSDGTNSTLTNPTKTFPSGGYKTINLTITDSTQGCFGFKTETFILTSPIPCTAAFIKTVSGFSVSFNNLSANGSGSAVGLNYLWSFGDGTTSTQRDPLKVYASTGVKIITLSISDSSIGCSTSVTDSVLIAPPPVLCSAGFSLATDTLTPFHFFLLNTSIIRSNSTFFWDFGDGTTSTSMTPAHNYTNFGTYFICLKVSDTLCTSTFCDTIGMDSTGMLLKKGGFGFHTLDFTTVSTNTGMKEIAAATQYAIYPNPSNGDVFIEYTLQDESPLTINITDITGKLVLSKTTRGLSGKHTETVDLRDLDPAVYFISIQSTGTQKNYKLIKN
jgi:PKD repeat protein